MLLSLGESAEELVKFSEIGVTFRGVFTVKVLCFLLFSINFSLSIVAPFPGSARDLPPAIFQSVLLVFLCFNRLL